MCTCMHVLARKCRACLAKAGSEVRQLGHGSVRVQGRDKDVRKEEQLNDLHAQSDNVARGLQLPGVGWGVRDLLVNIGRSAD